jgi:hypothetical protein
MRIIVSLLLTLLWCSKASAQANQCRTSPVGTSTAYCASEAFVTESALGGITGPSTSIVGDLPIWANTTGNLLIDSGIPISALGTAINYTSALTGGVSRTFNSKLGDVLEAADFGVVCDGSTVTGNALRAAVAAAQGIHGTLHISAQNVTGVCILNASTISYGIQITQPFVLECDPAVWIKPDTSFVSTTNVFDIIGGTNYLTYDMKIHCNIGDPTVATRNGRIGIFLDTQITGNYIAHFDFRGKMTAGTTGNYGIEHVNNVTNNPNGGLFLSTIGDHQSVIQGGLYLDGSGDSITIGGNFPYNSASGADNSGILVDLTNTAGALTLDHLNFSQCGGVNVQYAITGSIDGGEYELQCSLTGMALINLSATAGTIRSFQINPQSMSAIAGIGTPLLLNIGSNIALPALSQSYIATPTSYTGVNNASPSFICGGNFFNTGATHVSGTAPAGTWGNGC